MGHRDVGRLVREEIVEGPAGWSSGKEVETCRRHREGMVIRLDGNETQSALPGDVFECASVNIKCRRLAVLVIPPPPNRERRPLATYT